MSRRVRVIGLAAAMASAACAASAQKPQYSSQDIINTFANKPAAAPTAAGGVCEQKGMVTGDDGVCEPVKNSRGFSLPTRANLHPAGASASAPAARAAVPAATPSRSRTVATATTHRSAPAASASAAAAPAAHRNLLITFKAGSSELTDQAKANARVFAQALNSPALAGTRFDIAGYTDASGDKDKNLALSQSRAAAVKAYLVSQGVSDSRLEAQGFGASDFATPSNPNSPRNRRVEARKLE